MDLRTTYYIHQDALENVRRYKHKAVSEQVRAYRMRVRSLEAWCHRHELEKEWGALIAWWKCREPAEYEAVKRKHGKYLTHGLKKWHATELYKYRKRMRKLGY